MRQVVTAFLLIIITAGLTTRAAAQSLEDLGADPVRVARTMGKHGEVVWRSSPIHRPATGVVVRGTSSARDLSGWVRFDDGPWHELYIVFSATEDLFLGGYHGRNVVEGGVYELRFDAPVELEATGVFDGREDSDRAVGVMGNDQPRIGGDQPRMGGDQPRAGGDPTRAGGDPTPAGGDPTPAGGDSTMAGGDSTMAGGDPTRAGGDSTRAGGDQTMPGAAMLEAGAEVSGVIIPPSVAYRSDWEAEPFIGNPVPLARPDYLYLTFHHAAGFGAYTYEEGLEQVKAIQLFHQNGRGWSDIGYHFLMDQSGRIYQGRPFLNGPASIESIPPLALGAHAGGHNTGNIGLCVLGCYHPPAGDDCEDLLSEAALDSLAVMFAFLAESYGIPAENLRGHRDWGDTACPGDNNYVLLDELRERVRTLLITGNQPVGTAQLAASTDESGVVHLSWSFLDDAGIVSYRVVRAQGGQTTVVYEGESATDGSAIDPAATKTGPVVYRLYATSSDGREQLLTAIEASVGRPEQYVLAESFPNPFSRATTIRYYLPQDGYVRLAVYDLLGREIDVLVDAHQSGGEWYLAELDASGLPAGAYFYRIEVEGFSGVVFKESRSLIRIR